MLHDKKYEIFFETLKHSGMGFTMRFFTFRKPRRLQKQAKIRHPEYEGSRFLVGSMTHS
jgi:hypothetical protein